MVLIKSNFKSEFGVYVNSNVYGNKPPYKNCQIIPDTEKLNSLFEKVFSGTFEECEEVVKENCESKI